jgi:SNF2 family DNA or RNA helicase
METDSYALTITGATSLKDRQSHVARFQTDPACRVIIGSIGAMGVGWTLTAAEHVIFVELDPRPGAMNQAIDRAHRIGSKGTMLLIWYLVGDNTLCSRMAKIIVKKQGVINVAIDGMGT